MRKLLLAAAIVVTALASQPTPVKATTGHRLFSATATFVTGGCGTWMPCNLEIYVGDGFTYAIVGTHAFEDLTTLGYAANYIELDGSNIGATGVMYTGSIEAQVGSTWYWQIDSPYYGTAYGTATRIE
jgi:hypothetical protein